MPRPKLEKQKRLSPKPAPLLAYEELAQQQSRGLLRLLGYAPATTLEEEFQQYQPLRSVWILFGKYRSFRALDQYPSPGYLREILSGAIRKIDDLQSYLMSCDEWTREVLTFWLTEDSAPSLPEIECNLDSLRYAAGHAIYSEKVENEKVEKVQEDTIDSEKKAKSSGRPDNAAIKILVNDLRTLFELEYVGSASAERPPKSGNRQPLSPLERCAREFVKLALDSEKITHHSYLVDQLFSEENVRREADAKKAREAQPRLARTARRQKKGT